MVSRELRPVPFRKTRDIHAGAWQYSAATGKPARQGGGAVNRSGKLTQARRAIAAGASVLLVVMVSVWCFEEAGAADPNAFNRLMKPPSERNPPPTLDGIHDPTGSGVKSLQKPKDSFSKLPGGKSGNYVDWVTALDDDKIQPRFDRLDPAAEPIVMDLNIVREVKGSMPEVVYPHKQHTEWLDCSNCHPAIFIPQKGANNISMASILMGEQCGVCHGKVAFPVAECRRCHSRSKDKAETVSDTDR